jgi:hypothetical protein
MRLMQYSTLCMQEWRKVKIIKITEPPGEIFKLGLLKYQIDLTV